MKIFQGYLIARKTAVKPFAFRTLIRRIFFTAISKELF